MAKKGTRKNGRGTAKKGGGLFDRITAYLPSWFKPKESYVATGTANVTANGTPPSSTQQPGTNGDVQSPYQSPYQSSPNTVYPRMGGKKRKPTLKGGDGVTGHTQSGVASGAYKIGGRTRKQRKSRKSRRH